MSQPQAFPSSGLAHSKKKAYIYSSLYSTDRLKAALQTSERAQCGRIKEK